jgi:hypothetical protein
LKENMEEALKGQRSIIRPYNPSATSIIFS